MGAGVSGGRRRVRAVGAGESVGISVVGGRGGGRGEGRGTAGFSCGVPL